MFIGGLAHCYFCRLKAVLSKNHLIDRLICELGQFDQPNIIFKVINSASQEFDVVLYEYLDCASHMQKDFEMFNTDRRILTIKFD